MNFAGADSLVMAYPTTTADHVGIVSTRRENSKFQQKYEARGYCMFDSAFDFWEDVFQPSCAPQGYCPQERRKFGDTFCLCLRDKQTLAGHLPCESADVESALWVYGGEACGNKGCIGLIQPHVETVVLETTNIMPTL